MDTIAIRRPDPDEWRLYRSVRLAALTQAPEAFGSSAERELAFGERTWRERLTARNTLLAEADGQAPGGAPADGPCGLAGIVLADGELPPGAAELVSVWVAPAARGQGVGEKLVAAALARAGELGARELRLWVAADNPAARRLYERLGFRPTGAVQPIRPGEPRTELEMVRDVPPAGGVTAP